MLGEIVNFNRGSTLSSKDAIFGPYPVISGGQKPAFFHNKYNRTGETITVAGSGAYAGFVSFWDKPVFCADCFSVDPKDKTKILTKYIYYCLVSKQQQIYDRKYGAGIPHVHGKDISKFKLFIPNIRRQKEIITILDGFDRLINSVSDGLPAEIALRQKQYEYYRNKLLTFKELRK